ncbi:hypothetical protein EV193_109129 [Herbihabitans rhizosphaerae]|uniref:Prenyltransferase/squalene oxidase-like repeat protein n=1 Tax=Herbihabitans rhizosphaerae TaxID=1872711 RepID=A0A4Q7KGG5_9PSEU|nr:hypothetical protein [Herbihabitans rhizosphaerae]RZS34342.1 hypothetical protein EV193_109129 [Herbihabitans rhizosphaerae]
MKRLDQTAIDAAETYVLSSARVLERHQFAHMFRSGDAEPVLAALAAYRNPDGGFGNALEPDGRGPGSQPVTVLFALSLLDELGAVDSPMGRGTLDYLVSISTEDGGVPFIHPNIRDYPKAWRWAVPETYAGSLLPTGNIAGVLHKNKIDHPWLDRATEFCWRAVEAMTETSPYEALAAVGFLDNVPDRDRAAEHAERVGKIVRDGGVVALAGESGDVMYPHTFAPRPDGVARAWFTDEEMEISLDKLVDLRGEDGAWPVPWEVWTPAVEFEWRPVITIGALATLRAYGRL